MSARFGISAFLLFGLVAAPAAAADSSGAGGDWVFHVDWGPQLRYDMLCHLGDDAGKITGACQGISGTLFHAHGRQDANVLKFDYSTTYMSYDLTVHYDGKRDSSGAVSGSVQAATAPGLFDASGPIVFASDKSVAWSLHTRLYGTPDYDLFCTFGQDDTTVRGLCAGAGGPLMTPAGSRDATKITFSYTSDFLGHPARSQFDGTVSGDEMQGTLSSDVGGTGTFTARRR